jgi:hypothetical protein
VSRESRLGAALALMAVTFTGLVPPAATWWVLWAWCGLILSLMAPPVWRRYRRQIPDAAVVWPRAEPGLDPARVLELERACFRGRTFHCATLHGGYLTPLRNPRGQLSSRGRCPVCASNPADVVLPLPDQAVKAAASPPPSSIVMLPNGWVVSLFASSTVGEHRVECRRHGDWMVGDLAAVSAWACGSCLAAGLP